MITHIAKTLNENAPYDICSVISIDPSIYRSIYLSIDLSIYRSIDPSIDPSIHRSIDRWHTHTHTRTHTHAYIHTYIHTYMYIYIHMYLHTCIHVYMHTHTHTHTHLRLAARCHGAHESGIPKIARMSTSVQMLALLQAHFYFDLQSILGLKLVLGFLGSTTVCFDFCLFPLQPCRKLQTSSDCSSFLSLRICFSVHPFCPSFLRSLSVWLLPFFRVDTILPPLLSPYLPLPNPLIAVTLASAFVVYGPLCKPGEIGKPKP